MTTLTPRKQQVPPDKEQGALIKLVVFPVGQLKLALSMSAISRVINMPQVYGSGLNPVGLTTLGNMQLTIVDLHHQLFHSPTAHPSGKAGYLIILPTPQGYPIGIPTTTTPALVDVPEAGIRELPAAYRQADTLSIASHITRITTETGEVQSVFLLDVAAVVAPFSTECPVAPKLS